MELLKLINNKYNTQLKSTIILITLIIIHINNE